MDSLWDNGHALLGGGEVPSPLGTWPFHGVDVILKRLMLHTHYLPSYLHRPRGRGSWPLCGICLNNRRPFFRSSLICKVHSLVLIVVYCRVPFVF